MLAYQGSSREETRGEDERWTRWMRPTEVRKMIENWAPVSMAKEGFRDWTKPHGVIGVLYCKSAGRCHIIIHT